MENCNYEGERFLLKLYDKGLYDKASVKHSASKGDDKFEAVRKYLDRLEGSRKVFSREKKSAVNYLKRQYYDKYVIKPEDISLEYLDKKRRIAEERGVSFSKKSEISKVIKWQKRSLDKWLDYLMSDKIDYPMWVRYWAFQGMLKLGNYDYVRHAFGTRTKRTIGPFANLDEDSLNSAMDSIMVYYSEDSVDDEELTKLVKQGNFGKIYSRFLWINENKVKDEVKESNLGIWRKYNQGSDYKKMQKAVDGKFTFWCIEEEAVAEDYISVADVYIYFTKDANGNYTMPRVAIVTEFDEVTEIRGISDASQNVEGELLGVVSDKLKDIKHAKKFDLMLSDMKYLYKMIDKDSRGEDLNKDEIKFLYEVDRDINCFGKDKDSEIIKFKRRRNIKKDYGKIYGCSSSLVGNCLDDLSNDLYVYIGNIEINDEKLSSDFRCPVIVLGDFEVPYLEDADGLENLSLVSGNLVINNIVNGSGLSNLKTVGGKIYAGSLEKGLSNLEMVDGKNYIREISGKKKVR